MVLSEAIAQPHFLDLAEQFTSAVFADLRSTRLYAPHEGICFGIACAVHRRANTLIGRAVAHGLIDRQDGVFADWRLVFL